jgi:hypothetical protein
LKGDPLNAWQMGHGERTRWAVIHLPGVGETCARGKRHRDALQRHVVARLAEAGWARPEQVQAIERFSQGGLRQYNEEGRVVLQARWRCACTARCRRPSWRG